MLEEVNAGRRGKKKRLTRGARKRLYMIALAVLPIVTATGILTEEMAALYATLLGAILVPWLGIIDTANNEQEETAHYLDGLDDGYQAATGHDEGETWR